MKKEFFEQVLSIPSPSKSEDMMRDFIVNWGKSHGCKTHVDGKGNVTLTKGSPGSGKFYPCLANHMDSGAATHNHDQDDLVEQKKTKEIVWKGNKAECVNPLTGKQVGLGMDDQGGCAIAMSVLEKLPFGKAVFVVEEEIAMQGSEAFDKHFFDDCAFIISNDSPERNRATHYSSGVQLYSDDFFTKFLEPICSKHGVSSFRSEPYTDILKYRKYTMKDGKHIECLNFGNGGYAAHMSSEYADFNDVNAAEDLLYALCTEIPLDKQYTSDIGEEPRPTYNWTASKLRGNSGQMTFDFDTGDFIDDDHPTEVTYKDRDDTDMCSISLMFDDAAQYDEFVDKVNSDGIAVDISESKDLTAEVFGELQEVKRAYIFWYQLFYDSEDIKTWDDLVNDLGDEDFNDSVVFEEPYDDAIDVEYREVPDNRPSEKKKSDADEFWEWIEAHK